VIPEVGSVVTDELGVVTAESGTSLVDGSFAESRLAQAEAASPNTMVMAAK
jgi:hypothetical protein